MTLPFDHTHDLDLWVSRSESGKVLSQEWGGRWCDWCEMKRNELILYWADCMTLPFDHTHDLDLWVSRSESGKALSQEWGGRLTINEKDVSHSWYWLVWPWWGGRMYRIVTGVTSDVGVPSTYLVSVGLCMSNWILQKMRCVSDHSSMPIFHLNYACKCLGMAE